MTDRWLLDQNFPKPVFENIAELDRSSQFERFSYVAPDLAEVSTPDFMVYLVAEGHGFAGVVTRDLSQLEDDDSLVALSRLAIRVVTWKRGIDDALVLWGQLLAYMPQVRRLLGQLPGACRAAPSHSCCTASDDSAVEQAVCNAGDQRRNPGGVACPCGLHRDRSGVYDG